MIAPLPLIYADLLATGDPRCIETAGLIRERYIGLGRRQLRLEILAKPDRPLEPADTLEHGARAFQFGMQRRTAEHPGPLEINIRAGHPAHMSDHLARPVADVAGTALGGCKTANSTASSTRLSC